MVHGRAAWWFMTRVKARLEGRDAGTRGVPPMAEVKMCTFLSELGVRGRKRALALKPISEILDANDESVACS